MRVGIMQPYFFPYLGHFALIDQCDEWIVFDITQYTPKTWMNRNRVLHPSSGAMWVTVALANSSQSILTREAKVLDAERTLQSIRGQISHYKRHAPYFREVVGLLERSFAALSRDCLVELDTAGLRAVCDYLGIAFDPRICSELNLDLPASPGAGGWAPAIASALGASSYLNPAGGRQLFDPADFERVGVELCFSEMDPFVYDTGPFTFEPNLSILDVLMWNSPAAVRDALAGARVTPSA
ncbi:MAG TPA: WbqC family protein [Solirubrobacteraceae bacterium]|nr:WbqC family protein [Solirubrobacteraceae bacterium]